MAISSGSKILASDVSAKIDTAGTGLAKSGTTLSLATVVTAGTVGGTSGATLKFGSTFTTPYVTYDAYGRVTGGGTRTLTLPTVNGQIGSALAANGTSITLPSGGTWFVWNTYGIQSVEQNTYFSHGTSTASGTSSSGFYESGNSYGGGTTVYAKRKTYNYDKGEFNYSQTGKLVAIKTA